MTIDIANRLVELRKKHGLSQEQLAEKLGLSRQAVSKWERAEASPDTDNLIMLSRLYEVSLDELLNSDAEDEEFVRDKESKKHKDDAVHIDKGGIHVETKSGDVVNIGWDGIHVHERNGTYVNVGVDGVYVDESGEYCGGYGQGKVVINGVEYSRKDLRDKYRWITVAYSLLIATAFITIYVLTSLGVLTSMWYATWLLFLTIPMVSSLVMAIVYRDAHTFAFPVVATLVYLVLGLFFNLWHPGWMVFLTIPLYYTIWPKRRRSVEVETENKQ
jgi:Predicted transcriptional regulators